MLANFNRRGQSSLIDELKEGHYTPHLVIYSVLASSVAVLTALSLSFSYGKLASKPQTTMVQSLDGVIPVKEQDYLYRSPTTIRNFTGKTLSALMNWTGKTVDEYGVIRNDPGVNVGQNSKIPTMASELSNAFTTDGRLRSQVIERISGWVDQDYFNGKKSQLLDIQKIMIPQAIEGKDYHWKVNVIATRVIKQGVISKPINFNRSLYIRAVPIVDNPAPDSSTPEQKAFYKVRSYGLEIYRMEKFSREDF